MVPTPVLSRNHFDAFVFIPSPRGPGLLVQSCNQGEGSLYIRISIPWPRTERFNPHSAVKQLSCLP